jgi:hypothetical protein
MQKNQTEALKDVIQRYLQAIGAKQKLKEIRLKKSWNLIMGKNIEEQTEAVWVKKGTLFVKLHSSVLKYELSMMKSKIIEHLNQNAGETVVNDIVFV